MAAEGAGPPGPDGRSLLDVIFALPELSSLAAVLRLALPGTLGDSLRLSEKGGVLLRGVGTLRYFLILSESSTRQVPVFAVAA